MSKSLKHLLLVTLEDPYNPSSWSGIPYNMRLALEGRVEKLSVLSALKPARNPKDVILRIALGGKPPRYPLYLTTAAQKQFARQTASAIRELRPDAMLVISSHCIVRLQPPDIPVFMFTDAPWISFKETYKDFDPMPLLGPRFAELEAAAAKRCTGLIFSSRWAASEAERLYGVSPDKLHVQPMGANWIPGILNDEMSEVIQRRPLDQLTLLYVGKDWERKGGPLAIQIAMGLRAAGVTNVRLHIVGCTPQIPQEACDIVEVHGLLKAAISEQATRLRNLFLNSHFLVVPTKAECFGLVFAEAHAFGLPAISRAVQAVPSIIQDDQTGILEPIDAPAENYVRRIKQLLVNKTKYRKMALAARNRFETKLNWQCFAEGVVQTIEQHL